MFLNGRAILYWVYYLLMFANYIRIQSSADGDNHVRIEKCTISNETIDTAFTFSNIYNYTPDTNMQLQYRSAERGYWLDACNGSLHKYKHCCQTSIASDRLSTQVSCKFKNNRTEFGNSWGTQYAFRLISDHLNSSGQDLIVTDSWQTTLLQHCFVGEILDFKVLNTSEHSSKVSWTNKIFDYLEPRERHSIEVTSAISKTVTHNFDCLERLCTATVPGLSLCTKYTFCLVQEYNILPNAIFERKCVNTTTSGKCSLQRHHLDTKYIVTIVVIMLVVTVALSLAIIISRRSKEQEDEKQRIIMNLTEILDEDQVDEEQDVQPRREPVYEEIPDQFER